MGETAASDEYAWNVEPKSYETSHRIVFIVYNHCTANQSHPSDSDLPCPFRPSKTLLFVTGLSIVLFNPLLKDCPFVFAMMFDQVLESERFGRPREPPVQSSAKDMI